MSTLTKSLKDVGYRTAMMYVLGYTYKKDEEFNVDDFEKIMKAHYPAAFETYGTGGSRFGVFIQQMRNELFLIPLEKGYGVKKYRFSGFSTKNIQTFAKAGLDLNILRTRHADIIPEDVPVAKPVKKIVQENLKSEPSTVQELKSRIADLSAIVDRFVVPSDSAKTIAEKFPFLLNVPEEKIAKIEQLLAII